jgi:hypothetical protein
MFDQAKAALQVMKMKREIEGKSYSVEENGFDVEVGGFMAMTEPKIKNLKINGVENKKLVEAINRALEKATKASVQVMKDMGEGLQKGM